MQRWTLTIAEDGRIVRRTNLTSHDQVSAAVSVDYAKQQYAIGCRAAMRRDRDFRDDPDWSY